MADYVSKYTGNEVDGILDEAIELPQGSSEDVGKFLKYIGDTHLVEWDNIEVLPAYGCSDYADSILTVRYQSGEGNVVSWYKASYEDAGKFLKYSDNTGIMWDNVPGIDTSEADSGDFLRYGSNGLEWDNPIDISEASNKDVLMYVGGTALIGWRDPFNISNANDGDFLKYDGNGDITWDNPIDTTNANDGDVLKYDGNGNFISWGKPIDTTGANDGEFLRYSSNTGIYWDTIFPDSGSNGEVLIYGDNGPEWDSLPLSSIPCGSCYDILITNGANEIEWASASDIEFLPTAPSSGLILVSSSNGPTWVHPSEILQ